MTTKNFNVKKGIGSGNAFFSGNLVTANVGSNLVPNSNSNLSLGAPLARYKDLYLANVVDINGQTISANATTVSISGNVAIDTLNSSNVNANLVVANVVQANIGNIGNISANYVTVNVEVTTDSLRANSANVKSVIVQNDLTANTANINTIAVNNQLIINSTTDATSTTTGSFVTAGGVGIQKNLYVGGALNLVNGQGDQTKKGVINYNDGVESIDFKFNG